MNIINVKVNFEKGTCETTGINLVTGDYNSTKMIFNFDRDTGTKVFEMKSPSEQLVMVQEIQNNEIILYGLDEDENIASIFNEEGYYIFEISLYENESKLTSAKGKIKVKPEQVIIDGEVVEAYLPIFDQLMQQVTTAITETNNLDLDMNNDDGVVTATLTKKDGTTKEVEIIDTGDYYTKDEVDSIKTTIEGEIPTKVSQLTNDSAFINKEVNNLTYYTLATGTGSTIELSINSSTYVMTLNLKNSAGTTISTGSIDLPLETMVVDGSYDSTNKKIVLELDNGNTIDIPVGDLISGLQTEITNSNKLSSDLVDDTGHTNKFVTSSNKTTWNAKYDKPSGGIPKTDLASAVQTSLGKADTALQSHQDITGKEDKSNKVTTISGSSTDTQYPSAKCVYDSQVAQDTLIEDLQTEKDYMESIINQLPKVSGTGTSITLDNTIQAKMNMSLAPTELSQDGTPTPSSPQDIHTISGNNSVVVNGKNLLGQDNISSLSTATGTYNGDTLTFTSTATYKKVEWFIPAKVGDTFTFSCGGNDTLYLGIFEYSRIATDSNYRLRAIAWDTAITTNGKTQTFTIQNNCYLRVYLGSQPITTTTISNIMLEKGSTATEYEEYKEQTAPINLDTIEYCKIGDYEDEFIRTNGKNLFDIQSVVKGRLDSGVIGYESNTTALTKGDNSITFTTNANYRGIATDYIEVDGGNEYYMSIENDRTGIGMGVHCFTENKTFISNPTSIAVDSHTVKYNIPSETKYVRVGIQLSTAGTITINNPQLEKGSATSYEPYGINQWYLIKNIGKVVLDGTESWEVANNTDSYLYFQTSTYDSLINTSVDTAYSNRFSKLASWSSQANGYIIFATTRHLRLRIDGTLLSDISTTSKAIQSFKSWLNTNNTIFYFVLSTPTYTKITGTLETQLENIYKNMLSYKGTTNVSQINNDLPFVISSSAIMDLNNLITRIEILESEV